MLTPFDPARIEGRWYQVASFPARFEAGCFAATADYALRPDGTVSVTNRCREWADPSQMREITGTARQVSGGKLRVALNGVPITGSFWVLDLSPDGRTLVVGTALRTGGWVLSRENRVNPHQIDRAKAVFARNGYDVAALQRTRLAR